MPVNWNVATTASSTFTMSTAGTYGNNYKYYQFYNVDEYGNKYFEHDPWAPEPQPEEPEEQALWDLI